MEYFEETISIHYISVILVFLFVFEPSFPLDLKMMKRDRRWKVEKKGKGMGRKAFVYSKSMEFVAVKIL